MAQPSSVQREPSMEEILASIRRIIEDDETAVSRNDEPRRQSASSPVLRRVDEFQPSLRESPFSFDSHSSVFDNGHRAHRSGGRSLESSNERSELAVDDFLRGRVPELSRDNRELSRLQPESLQRYNVTSDKELGQTGGSQPHVTRTQRESVVTPFVSQGSYRSEAGSELSEKTAARVPLLSEEPRRQIASSFGELNEAFVADHRKSLAGTAEDVLRPMLRDWLDKNLPQLVERLVSDEVKRIARGE